MNSAEPPALLATLPPAPAGRTGWPWNEETSPTLYAETPAGGWCKITIVCPSFRQGQFIEETIRSVLLQNYPRLEFIVIDGGSDDATVPILRRYAPWLTHWESERDRGQSHALNKGFARASGDLYGWINSDDYYQPGALATVARHFHAGRREYFYGDWHERLGEEPGLRLHREQPAFAFQVAVGGRTLPSHTTFWPAARHLPFNENLHFTLDADLFKRLAVAGLRPRHIAQPLGVFRRHAEAKTTTMNAVGSAETEAWGRTQSRLTHLRWLASRAIDRLRALFSA